MRSVFIILLQEFSEIDRVIEQEVYNKIEEFENKKIGYQALEPDVSSSIWIDYESYIKGDIISVVFIQKRIFPLWHILLNVLIRWYLK